MNAIQLCNEVKGSTHRPEDRNGSMVSGTRLADICCLFFRLSLKLSNILDEHSFYFSNYHRHWLVINVIPRNMETIPGIAPEKVVFYLQYGCIWVMWQHKKWWKVGS